VHSVSQRNSNTFEKYPLLSRREKVLFYMEPVAGRPHMGIELDYLCHQKYDEKDYI